MWIKKALLAMGAFAGVALSAGEAEAHQVCLARYFPSNGTLGNEGYVQFTMYSAPDCTGAFVGVYYLCTGGASNTVCPSSVSYRYERSGMLNVFQALTRADGANYNVVVATTTCIGGGAGCAAFVSFE